MTKAIKGHFFDLDRSLQVPWDTWQDDDDDEEADEEEDSGVLQTKTTHYITLSTANMQVGLSRKSPKVSSNTDGLVSFFFFPFVHRVQQCILFHETGLLF